MLVQLVWHEARGLPSEEQILVVWCVLNRVDDWGQSIYEVLTTKGQFMSSYEGYPIEEEICQLCEQCLLDWESGMEAPILEPYTVNSNYKFYYGDGKHNWFREVY